jgi:hypothetical protein
MPKPDPQPQWPRCSVCRKRDVRPGMECDYERVGLHGFKRCPFVLDADGKIMDPKQK